VFVYSTCVTALIGDDIDAVCKRAGERFGLPVVPGSPGIVKTIEEGKKIARDCGYPVLIKAVAGKLSHPLFDARQIEFNAEAMAALRSYSWPGNLAEFEQLVSQVITQAKDQIVTSAHLPLRVRNLDEWPTLAQYLAEQERQYQARVLSASSGDKERAAKVLGVDLGRLG